MRSSRYGKAFVALVVTTALAACGTAPPPAPAASAAPPPTAPDACSELAGACHEHDSKLGNATIHECHVLGHAHKLEACIARKQECLAACAGHAR